MSQQPPLAVKRRPLFPALESQLPVDPQRKARRTTREGHVKRDSLPQSTRSSGVGLDGSALSDKRVAAGLGSSRSKATAGKGCSSKAAEHVETVWRSKEKEEIVDVAREEYTQISHQRLTRDVRQTRANMTSASW